MATQSSAVIDSNDATRISRSDFPADFIMGTGSSAYQIEGGARDGGRGPSIWDTFTHRRPDMIRGGTNGDVAVDSYHLYKEDVNILKNLGLDAYRFSISWSRVLPGGRLSGGVNKEGINYYNNLIDGLLANGIKPFVTLFHWDVPQALEDEYGGFLSPRIVDDFCEYAELCFWEFGDRVKHWMTLNQPWTFSVHGYATGLYAPGRGRTSPEHVNHPTVQHRCSTVAPQCICSTGNPGTEPYWVTHHLLLAHAAAVELYKNKFQRGQEGQIGISHATQWMEPWDENSASDVEAAARALDFMLGWFMEPITSGDYPKSMKKFVGSRLPKFSPEQSKMLKGSYDFVGLNYYTASYVTNASTNSSGSNNFSYNTDIHVTYETDRNGVPIGPQSGSDWLLIYPEGIRKILVYTKKTYNVPLIYVTENGVDDVKNTNLTLSEARKDSMRLKYLQDHIFNVRQAMNDGVNVKGYFAWSLLDNFEWGEGYGVRFGIIHIDYNDNFARYPKDSAVWLMNSFHK
uniref:Raucaffricine-O-beta-D-glucosidase n=1 Tax=Rauvolfia serpentina TaxID=4060 RepID=UPI0002380B7F|nr:Chain A, Raucaffricine-O-beta-D-glucosidase [Rauvolfia serpentina]3U57_B Chain B, Raucaffricine-O-beta-D-glucosidase [Rauvolfia serpentina]3U5U_A Chain A, Raucaffricine-O-beta-D-glucosidase [Rauvolfia serpentina]3U5U_B Chain B, Raucaffricine-O-beta-D-glucosidase [Rauvolfia serpentina]3U5Y_A Chain A, Raucaffricine-O-beta-D-glucosidase [Rauvolfia serpentina]3U5Y_B Chain B, Raucaffricine-O-beta-D-glucosidase [Rauvolfia serpentina]4EK7_A Chain A, Raucaffricine-O-beta-D-glucosidase [Rauvolfia s